MKFNDVNKSTIEHMLRTDLMGYGHQSIDSVAANIAGAITAGKGSIVRAGNGLIQIEKVRSFSDLKPKGKKSKKKK